MKKALIVSIILLCAGCSVTIVYAPKSIEAEKSLLIHPINTGSDLDGNTFDKTNEVKGNKAGLPGA